MVIPFSNPFKSWLFFIAMFLAMVCIHGQEKFLNGVPLINNYHKNDVKANLKVFGISQSEEGELFFATPGNLITYDGLSWEKYSEKNQTDLRDVLFVNDQEIYTSGHGGFGVWRKNKFGQLEYESLYFKTPTKDAPLLPVFTNIIKVDDLIYFQSFQQIYIFNRTSRSIEIIYAAKGFTKMLSLDKKLYVQDSYLGLFEIKGNRKFLVDGTQNQYFEIIGLSNLNGVLLITTKNDGFWEVDNGKILKKKWKSDKLFKNKLITDILRYDDTSFIIATVRDGIYIISDEGLFLDQINRDNGIRYNSIRKVFKDNNNNIWLATEGGLSYIELNSNLKFILSKNNEFGTVYSSLLKDSILYLGTNQGLFKRNIVKINAKPVLLDNSVDQIWEIFEDQDDILIGSHKGVFKLVGNSLRTIHLEGGAWTFRRHPVFKDLMYVGFYSGLAVFKRIQGNWKFVKKFENFADSSRFVEFDSSNQIWVSHPSKGYYRLKLSSDGLDIIEVDFYGVDHPAVDTFAYFTKIDENLVFFNPSGFYVHNSLDNSFTTASYPKRIFEGLRNLYFIRQHDNIFWYATDNAIGYVERKRGEFKNIQSPFYSLNKKNLKDFNKFRKLKENVFGINLDDSFAFYSFKENSNYPKIQVPLVKSIKAIGSKDTLTIPQQFNERISLPYRNNYLKVKVALPNIPYGNSRVIQYRLKGFQEQWVQKEELSEISFSGLPAGNYELEINSILDLDNVSKSIIIPFRVEQPWYLHNITKIVYVCIFFLVFYLYSAFLRRKNNRYVSRLKQTEQQKRQRQKEKYELEKLASDKELLLLKEKNLNLEIKKKSSALASSTLNNIKKNELLSDIIKDVKEIDKELLNSSLHYPIKKIIKKINSHLKDKEDWLTFELHFRNSHSQFFENLREAHPDLSSNEIKLSAYLKLNLSSKEIASLMHVAITSVEQSRYRLRKKMNLKKEHSLTKYIQNF